MKEGQALQGSPYVEQIEKYASSLKQLSHTFLELEAHKEEFSGADIDGMFDRVKERVCKKCEKNAWCWGENFVHTYQMGYDVLSAVDHYGNELNVETKRKLMQRCEKAPRFLREMLEAMEQAVKMHFMAFQQFMKQTGGDIGLSLQLTTSYMAAMLKGAQEQNEKEEKLLKLLLPSGKNNLTN